MQTVTLAALSGKIKKAHSSSFKFNKLVKTAL